MAGPKNPNVRQRIPRALRDQQILQLAACSVPCRRIGEQVGVSHATAARVIKRHLEELQAEIKSEAAGIRARHLMELRSLRQRLSKATAAGDVKAVLAWVRLQEREAKLCGLDLQAAAVDDAAQHNAARALLDELSDKLPAEVMDQIVEILAQHAPPEPETDAE